MSTPNVLHFVSLTDAAVQWDAKSVRAFVSDLCAMSDAERREIADLLTKKEG